MCPVGQPTPSVTLSLTGVLVYRATHNMSTDVLKVFPSFHSYCIASLYNIQYTSMYTYIYIYIYICGFGHCFNSEFESNVPLVHTLVNVARCVDPCERLLCAASNHIYI